MINKLTYIPTICGEFVVTVTDKSKNGTQIFKNVENDILYIVYENKPLLRLNITDKISLIDFIEEDKTDE